MNAISKWMTELDRYPGWKEWNRKKIGKTIQYGDWLVEEAAEIGDFRFSSEIEDQHAVVIGYIKLVATVHSLKDLEYYFRRYPFRGLPVSKQDHLSNVCEMYFNRFYEFRERAKALLNALKTVSPSQHINVGMFLKSFDQRYGNEIKERHSIHHRERFDDIQISQVGLTQMMSLAGDEKSFWRQMHNSSYRSAAREWAQRVRRRSASLEETQKAIAGGILECCAFFDISPKAL